MSINAAPPQSDVLDAQSTHLCLNQPRRRQTAIGPVEDVPRQFIQQRPREAEIKQAKFELIRQPRIIEMKRSHGRHVHPFEHRHCWNASHHRVEQMRDIGMKGGQIAVDGQSGESHTRLWIKRKGKARQTPYRHAMIAAAFPITRRNDHRLNATPRQMIQQQAGHFDDAIDLGQKRFGDNGDSHNALIVPQPAVEVTLAPGHRACESACFASIIRYPCRHKTLRWA